MKRFYKLLISILSLALFIVLIVTLKTVDVQAIGPNGSSVGLASLNKWFFESVGVHDAFSKISNIAFILTLASVAMFAGFGLYFWIKGKSLKAVPFELIVIGVSYFVMLAIYLLFIKAIVINYRPVLDDGKLESSFPSSHTFISLYIFLTSIIMFKDGLLLKDKRFNIVGMIALGALSLVTITSRILSGKHWCTDFIGGILLAVFMFFATSFLIDEVRRKKAIK